MICLEASAAPSLLAPGPTHLSRGEEWMKEESGRKSWVTLLEDVCFPLSVCCSLYIFVSTFFHFLPHVPGSSSVVLHVSAHRVCFQRGASRERWPSRRRDVASCCHWALLQLICSLIASLAFVLFLTQWPSTKETLSQSAVCLCVGVRFIVKHHVVQLVTVNIDDCYWRCSVNQTRPWMLTF